MKTTERGVYDGATRRVDWDVSIGKDASSRPANYLERLVQFRWPASRLVPFNSDKLVGIEIARRSMP